MSHRKVLVFGVFDGLHTGHQFFLNEAKKLGHSLIVVLTPDPVVQEIKGRLPRCNFYERKASLEKESSVDEVLEGDRDLGNWKVFEKIQPDVIAVGYDQTELKKSLSGYFKKLDLSPEIISLPAFEPKKYKSSLIGRSNN